MKYSNEMLKAHEETLEAYEKAIAFVENKENSLDDVRNYVKGFVTRSFSDCRYCCAAYSIPLGVVCISHPPNCEECLLGSDSPSCTKDTYFPIFNMSENPNNYARYEIRNILIERHGFLALQAEYNLGRKE